MKSPTRGNCAFRSSSTAKSCKTAATRIWCFSLPRLIAWITQALPLYPGDVVSTGTPAGVGLFQKPQVWLKPGDVCELEIFGIGKVDQSGEVMHALPTDSGSGLSGLTVRIR